MIELGELLFPVASLCGVIGMFVTMIGIAKLGDEVFAGSDAFAKLRTFFRNSMGVRTFARSYVASLFVMDMLYGRRIFSARAVFTSMATSCLWLSILIGVTVLCLGHKAWVFNPVFVPQVVHHFWGFLVIGLIVDYLALSTARVLLRVLPRRNSASVLATLAMAVISIALSFYLLYGLAKTVFLGQAMTGNPFDQITLWVTNPSSLMLAINPLNDWHFTPISPHEMSIRDGNSEVVYAFPEGLLFLSSQLALVWLALHACSHWLYFGGYRASKWAQRLLTAAAFESRPLQSSATVTALLALPPTWCIVMAWHYSPMIWRALSHQSP